MEVCWETLPCNVEIQVDRLQFWQALWTWMHKPHTVNQRIFCQSSVKIYKSVSCCLDFIYSILLSIPPSHASNNFAAIICQYLETNLDLQPCIFNNCTTISDECFLIVQELRLKNKKYTNPIEISFLNYSKNEVLFYFAQQTLANAHPFFFPFIVTWNDTKVSAQVQAHLNTISRNWLKFHFLPKIIKWAALSEPKTEYSDSNSSLHLIDVSEYDVLYASWKEKYGKKLIESWTECTNPIKFVYEDIAIAAYLHLLWGKKKIKFVDLGCGNGLLVFILSQEGHEGQGIDIRPRKIWSTYPSNTVLKVGAVTPKKNCNFPEIDWIIGNHSDELTPWIPIFATQSGPSCNFFLLPCCAFDLSGQKFQRRNTSLSTYNDHIEYVKTICHALEFKLSVDKLRIPSTKRKCIVGYGSSDRNAKDMKIKIDQILIGFDAGCFKIREPVEKVRNCTRVDKTITDSICDVISKELIRRQLLGKLEGNSVWSDDYSLTFGEAVNIISEDKLKRLKSEFGGLQTVLKNKHCIFKVQHSRIMLRKPVSKPMNAKWKMKLCWHFHNHPLKCPLLENECSYVH